MSKKIVFICGALRSGTSLVHLMLDSHPKIHNPGEYDFLFDMASDNGGFPDADLYRKWLLRHRIFKLSQLEVNKSLGFANQIYSFIDQLAIADSVLALNIHRFFNRIPDLFPEAKFIHIVRDPRDVARSSIGMGWAGNVYHGVEHWIDTESSWNKLVEAWPSGKMIEIRYEDLVSAPELALERICDFLGIEYSKKMLEYDHNSTYSKPDVELIFQWKKKLSRRDIQYVESRVYEFMNRYKYEFSGYPIIRVGIFERTYLVIKNKLFKSRYALERYGFALYLKELLARKLKLRSINENLREHMNNIDNKHLK